MKVAANSRWAPERGDMVWVNFNSGAGRKAKIEQPLLVLSTRAFNERTGIAIGLPVTHAACNDDNPFAVKCDGPKRATGYILTHQPQSFDWRARAARPHHWKRVAPAVFDAARQGLDLILRLSD